MKNVLMAYSITTRDSVLDFIPKIIISLYIDEILSNIENQMIGVFSNKDQLDKILTINRSKMS
jgi:hypothetical protein